MIIETNLLNHLSKLKKLSSFSLSFACRNDLKVLFKIR